MTDRAEACQRRNERRSDKAHRSRHVDIIGISHTTVASLVKAIADPVANEQFYKYRHIYKLIKRLMSWPHLQTCSWKSSHTLSHRCIVSEGACGPNVHARGGACGSLPGPAGGPGFTRETHRASEPPSLPSRRSCAGSDPTHAAGVPPSEPRRALPHRAASAGRARCAGRRAARRRPSQSCPSGRSTSQLGSKTISLMRVARRRRRWSRRCHGRRNQSARQRPPVRAQRSEHDTLEAGRRPTQPSAMSS